MRYASRPMLAALFFFVITPGLRAVSPQEPPSPFVTREGTELRCNGRPFYAAGTNAYYLLVYERLDPAYVTRSLDLFAASNVNLVRAWAFYDGSDFYSRSGEPILQTAPGVFDEASFVLLDKVVKKARDRNLKIWFTLCNFWHIYGGVLQYDKWAGYNVTTTDPDGAASNFFFTNPTTRTLYKNYVTYLLQRVNTQTGVAYKDEPAIFGWDLMNEARNPGQDPAILRNWYQEMARHIKSIDPHHLVATGEEGFDHNMDVSGSPYTRTLSNTYVLRANAGTSYYQNTQIPEIDFGTCHLYPDAFGFSTANDFSAWVTDSDTYFRDRNRIARSFQKPLVIGEYGWGYQGGWTADSPYKIRAYSTWWATIESQNIAGDALWMFATGAKGPEYQANIYDARDPQLTQLLREHGAVLESKSAGSGSGDTSVPVCSITAPVSGSTLTGVATVLISASDNVGVSRVDLLVDGAVKDSDSTAPFQMNLDTASLANGNHSLVARAFDAAGNSGTSSTVSISVNNPVSVLPQVLPLVFFDKPVGTEISTALTVSLTGALSAALNLTVNDIDTSAEVQFSLNGTPVALPASLIGDGGPRSGSIPIPLSGLVSGTNLLTFRFASNLSGSTRGFRIDAASLSVSTSDLLPPTISVATLSIAVTGIASDNGSVRLVTFRNAANGATGTATGTTTWSASIPVVTGTNPISFIAEDAAGNIRTSSITITYSAP